MITLRTGGYSDAEKKFLREIFQNASLSLMLDCINGPTGPANIAVCRTCELRHLCNDLQRAATHARTLVEESD